VNGDQLHPVALFVAASNQATRQGKFERAAAVANVNRFAVGSQVAKASADFDRLQMAAARHRFST